MNSRSVALVWLFAVTLIAGSCAITFYTAKLSLELTAEQENFKRSSISALVQNAALKELSMFEDVIYAATIKLEANQASRQMLNRVEWITQVDHFAYSEKTMDRSIEVSLPRSLVNGVELDQLTKAILFESSNKLNSRLIYLKPLSPIKQSSIMTAGLSLKKATNNQHFIIYFDLNDLLEKIVTTLKPLASVSLEHSGNKEPLSNSWAVQIPNLDIPVNITPIFQNGGSTELTGNGELKSLTHSIFVDDNIVTVILLNIALWIVVALMLREHYYRLKAQKHAFEISAQAEKNTNLAILGELATSIAHEINQPLAVLKMRTSMMLADEKHRPSKADQDDNLQVIEDQVHRCSEIVKSVQSLNSRTKLEAEKIKLDDFFRDIRAILDLQTEKYNGKLDLSCPKTLYVEFNKTALAQLALNLSRNGFEAMSHLPKTKRILTIKAKGGDRSYKNSTVIEFIDRGKGLTKAKQERVFDAFYSTKNTGTGLGLALSKTLAERNNAHISVESKEGVGSCFRVKMEAGSAATDTMINNNGGQA